MLLVTSLKAVKRGNIIKKGENNNTWENSKIYNHSFYQNVENRSSVPRAPSESEDKPQVKPVKDGYVEDYLTTYLQISGLVSIW